MKTRYQPLLVFQFLHDYFADIRAVDGFRIIPTNACARILTQNRIIMRADASGMALYAEVEADTDQARLFTDLGKATPVLRFWIEAQDPYLLNITDLPPYHPTDQVFYFNNLSDQRSIPIDDSPLYMGDSVVGKPVGNALALVAGPASYHTHRFSAATVAASFELKNVFDDVVGVHDVSFSAPVEEFRINLESIFSLRPGRYTLLDNHGGRSEFYYAPAVNNSAVFGVIEIYNTTTHLTADQSEKTPAAYRYISVGNIINNIKPFTIQLASRATTWRYIVNKKYSNNGISLAELDVVDTENAVSFSKALGVEQVIFTGAVPIQLREERKAPELHRSSGKLLTLPIPALKTALQQVPALAGYNSDMYVYI